MIRLCEPTVHRHQAGARPLPGTRSESAAPGGSGGTRESDDANWRSDIGRSGAGSGGPRAPGPSHSASLPRGGRQPLPTASFAPRGDASARRPLSRPPWGPRAPSKPPPPTREEFLAGSASSSSSGSRAVDLPPPPPAYTIPPPPPPNAAASPKRPPPKLSPYLRPKAGMNVGRRSLDIVPEEDDVNMGNADEEPEDAWDPPPRRLPKNSPFTNR